MKIRRTNSDDILSASNFYEKCLSHKLSPDDFSFSADGTTMLKLNIFPSLITSNLSAKMLGDYNSMNPKLYTDKLAGGVKACMGFVTDNTTGKYVPNTVLNEDIRNHVNNPTRVIAVYRTAPNSTIFNELTYVAKEIDLSGISKYIPYKLPFQTDSTQAIPQ